MQTVDHLAYPKNTLLLAAIDRRSHKILQGNLKFIRYKGMAS